MPSADEAAKPAATRAEAKELVAPVTGAATAQPEAVVPQEAQKKPPQVRRQPPSRKLQPGDLVCGECGEGNSATRKFCSRCGTSLAEAEVVKTPWWRRLLPRRGAKVRKSGERPKGRRGGKTKLGLIVSNTFKTVRRVIALLLVLGGVAYGLFTPFRGWVNERAAEAKGTFERIVFPQYAPVSAAEAPVAGVESVPEHPPNNAVDSKSDTYWGTPLGPVEPNMVVKFGRTVDLAKIIVHNGDGKGFKDTHRAQKLHLVFNTGKTTDINLQDRPDPQTVEIEEGEGVHSVEIHVESTFKSANGLNTVLAVSEIEFFEEL